MRILLLGLLCLLWSPLGGAAELLSLTNKKGVTIRGILLERGPDSAKVKVDANVYTLRFSQLTEETVEIIKKAKIEPPVSEDFRLDVKVRKSGEIKKSGRVIYDRDGNMDDQTGSYRKDTVAGTITVANRHNVDPTKGGTVRVVVLMKEEGELLPLHSQTFTFEPLDSLTDRQFEINPTDTIHSVKGMVPVGIESNGRYVGYIVAVLVEEEIVAIKSLPATYETDRLTAWKLLTASEKKAAEEAKEKDKKK